MFRPVRHTNGTSMPLRSTLMSHEAAHVHPASLLHVLEKRVYVDKPPMDLSTFKT
jgi:hypothetical protein